MVGAPWGHPPGDKLVLCELSSHSEMPEGWAGSSLLLFFSCVCVRACVCVRLNVCACVCACVRLNVCV